MKLLLDSCICPGAADELLGMGHEVVWVGDRSPDPGDDEVLNEAYAEQRLLVTLDKDFGELAIVFGKPHRGILRIVNFRAGEQAAVIQQIIESHSAEIQTGSIITAEPGRLRIRPADTDSAQE